MINLGEIIIVNGIGAVLMILLLLTRLENKDTKRIGEYMFDICVILTIGGCIIETLTFLVDGKTFFLAVPLSYIMNSFLFIGTSAVGYIWCLYADFRIHRNLSSLKKKSITLGIPMGIVAVLCIPNMFGINLIFSISESNVYARGPLVVASYLSLFFYFLYSIIQAQRANADFMTVRFFPVYYFVLPCMIGTVIQGLAYGITLGWTMVSVALLLVYLQLQHQNSYIDSLSGLYNRNYLSYILSRLKNDADGFFGIMLDMNGFKKINDKFGHQIGDEAIIHAAKILLRNVPQGANVIRFAGDEFIIIAQANRENCVPERIEENILKAVEEFNSSQNRPDYVISFAMGHCYFDDCDGKTDFLRKIDAAMYVDKKKYYSVKGNDRRIDWDISEISES